MARQVIDGGIHCQTTTLVAHLGLMDRKCLHTNVVKVYTIPLHQPSCNPSPAITSSTLTQQDCQLIRKTEIKYLTKLYIIEDIYKFEKPPVPMSESFAGVESEEKQPKQQTMAKEEKGRKICLFQKVLRTDNSVAKRNTKNLPKNFYKGFLSYMEELQGSQKSNEVLRQLSFYDRKVKYNNILIQRLVTHSQIAPYFRHFLENYAEKWIQTSRITDKPVHLQAIPIYLGLFDKLEYAQGNCSADQ